MMMIAFIIMNSGLVPLNEGLCDKIYELRFEILGGLHPQLLFIRVFFGTKNILKDKAVSPRSHPASEHIP